eukprot:scaffold9.g3177.t1
MRTRPGAAPLDMNPPKPEGMEQSGIPRKVVYVPACVTRIVGPAKDDAVQRESLCPSSPPSPSVTATSVTATTTVIYPAGLANTCCGEGLCLGCKHPVVCGTSPCLSQIKSALSEPSLRFSDAPPPPSAPPAGAPSSLLLLPLPRRPLWELALPIGVSDSTPLAEAEGGAGAAMQAEVKKAK